VGKSCFLRRFYKGEKILWFGLLAAVADRTVHPEGAGGYLLGGMGYLKAAKPEIKASAPELKAATPEQKAATLEQKAP
jgi:hypothetical protein